VRAGERGLRAGERGLRAGERGLRAGERGLRAGERGLTESGLVRADEWGYSSGKSMRPLLLLGSQQVMTWRQCGGDV